MKEVRMRFIHQAPLILHNGQTTDPSNRYSMAMKQISAKRKKTEADLLEMSRIEWFAGLYLNDDKTKIIVPRQCILATIISGAKKHKSGPMAKAGVFMNNDPELDFADKNVEIEKLWTDMSDKYVSRARVKIGQSAIMRTRPIFTKWNLDVTIVLDEDIVPIQEFKEWVKTGGKSVGLCDWRPQHGRFDVEFV